MIDSQKFIELKAKYYVPQENNNNYLYFILTKAEIDIDLLNDTDWNWLGDNYLKTFDLLEKQKQNKQDKITNLAEEKLLNLYNKYSFLFTSIPVKFLHIKHKFELKYAIKALYDKLASIFFKLKLSEQLSESELNYLKEKRLNENKWRQFNHFIKLKKTYNITKYNFVSPDDILYLILVKLIR